MLQGLFVLLLFQLLGETLARGFGLPAPGPVVGIVLLVAALGLRSAFASPSDDEQSAPLPVEQAADGLMRHFGLLFVPAGVGVAQSWHALSGKLLPVAGAIAASTIVTLVVVVAIFRIAARGRDEA